MNINTSLYETKLSLDVRKKIESLLKDQRYTSDNVSVKTLFEHPDILNNFAETTDSADKKIITQIIQMHEKYMEIINKITPSTSLRTMENVCLSKRTINALMRVNIDTIENLMNFMKSPSNKILTIIETQAKLLKVDGLGLKGLKEINLLMDFIKKTDSILFVISKKKNEIQEQIKNYETEIAQLKKELNELEQQQTLLTNGDNEK